MAIQATIMSAVINIDACQRYRTRDRSPEALAISAFATTAEIAHYVPLLDAMRRMGCSLCKLQVPEGVRLWILPKASSQIFHPLSKQRTHT
jgi:hypothetical protein